MTTRMTLKQAAAAGVLMLGLGSPAGATLNNLEGAAEVSRLTLKATTQQTVYARECDQCPLLTLSIDAQTQYLDGRRATNLARVAGRTRGATVFFHPKTFKVTRVAFWRQP
ncbi:MAG: hypothetical protein AAF610_10220 [Pseudomonadota bacterium]